MSEDKASDSVAACQYDRRRELQKLTGEGANQMAELGGGFAQRITTEKDG
jgi:hypothetical protein